MRSASTGFFTSWRAGTSFLVFLGVVGSSSTGLPEPPDLSEYLDQADTVRRLEKGDIVVFKRAKFTEIFGEDLMSDGKGTLTLFLVSAPATTTWNLLNDFDGHDTFMPHVTESVVESIDNEEYRVRYRYKVFWTDSTDYLFVKCDADAMTLVSHADIEHSDKRLVALNGFWSVRRYDEQRTLVASFRDVELSSAISNLARKLALSPRSGPKAIRRRVESLHKKSD